MTRSTGLAAFLLLVVGFVLALPADPAMGERTQSNLVLIREGDTVTEDLYAAADRIVIEGTIEGDLVAVAFSEVRIEGLVTGSVTAVTSGSVVVEGRVNGSVRAAAAALEIDGIVDGDVFTAAWDSVFKPDADVGRDALVWAWNATFEGRIGRNIEGQFRRGVLGAAVARDVDITVSDLTVGPFADVGGDLIYVGDENAEVAAEATVDGSVIAERRLAPNVRARALVLLGRLLGVLAIVGIGLALIWSAPERSEKAAREVILHPLPALAWGIGLVSIPVAMALIVGLFVGLSPPATGLPLLLIFAPLVLAVFGALMLATLAAPVPVAGAIGALLRREWSVYAWFLAGIAVITVIGLVPWLGTIATVAAWLVGLGGWMLGVTESDVGPGSGANE